MHVLIADFQNVGGTNAQIFELLQPTPVDSHIILHNAGSNTLLYTFYEYVAGNWIPLDEPNTDLNGSLAAGTRKNIQIAATYNRVKLEGAASGGTMVSFSIQRWADRQPGGTLPIISP